MMEDPIPVERNPAYTAEEVMAMRKQDHANKMSWLFGAVFGIVVLSLFVPLGVFLVRLAMGA